MPVFEPEFDEAAWRGFLREWDELARELLPHLPADDFNRASREFHQRGSILRDGASAGSIEAAERKLGRALPESMKRFYRVSNGLVLPLLDIQDAVILAVEELVPLRDSEPDTVSLLECDEQEMTDEEYLRYGEQLNPLHFRTRYARELVQLSTHIDAAILALNPAVVTPGGEWECVFVAFKAPGIWRYPTFEDMMIEQRSRTTRGYRWVLDPDPR
jgi:hypothetical protein